jgi:hypothetical protein
VTKPFTIEEIGDGKWRVHVVGPEETLERYLPHIAAKLGITEERLREQLTGASGSIVSQRPDAIRSETKFGGPDAIRSMVKASLVLWSILVGNDEVKSANYDSARKFVVQGDDAFNKSRTNLDSRYFDDVERMKKEYGPLFNMIYVRSNDAGRVVGHFTLYNLLAWQLTLAEAGGTPNAKIALVSNPENPSRWSYRAAEEFDVPFEWLNSPDYYSDNFVRSKARIDAMMEHYFEVQNPKEYARIVEDCRKKMGLESGAPVPTDKLSELRGMIAARFASHMLGLPHEEQITPEHMAQILKADKPDGGDA